jgi:predicted metal-dependent phosphoesterase TrpH
LQIHILGFAFAAADAALNAGLQTVRCGRIERARRMAAELEKVGIDGSFDGAMRLAANPNLVSRAHFGRHLVERGVCKDLRSVFESYLVPGRPGYVDHRWATLADSLAGFMAPAASRRWRIRGATSCRAATCGASSDEFRDLGGQAIEVMSGSHTPEHVDLYSRLAREYGFAASRGSDFHGPGESYVDLGRLPPLPEGLRPVWQLF